MVVSNVSIANEIECIGRILSIANEMVCNTQNFCKHRK